VPQLKLAQVPLSKLKAAAYNPRHMPDEELQALARSMAEFGVVDPIIANKDGTVIGGHQRLKAAQVAGIETLPVVYVDLAKDKEKALNLALNRIGGEWDEAKLRTLLEELAASDLDLELTGFSVEELDWLNDRGEPWTVEDALSELDMKDAVAQPVWVVIRAPAERAEEVREALAAMDLPDVTVETSY
jgi:ParB-like chromosome segregation protein Spo0J